MESPLTSNNHLTCFPSFLEPKAGLPLLPRFRPWSRIQVQVHTNTTSYIHLQFIPSPRDPKKYHTLQPNPNQTQSSTKSPFLMPRVNTGHENHQSTTTAAPSISSELESIEQRLGQANIQESPLPTISEEATLQFPTSPASVYLRSPPTDSTTSLVTSRFIPWQEGPALTHLTNARAPPVTEYTSSPIQPIRGKSPPTRELVTMNESSSQGSPQYARRHPTTALPAMAHLFGRSEYSEEAHRPHLTHGHPGTSNNSGPIHEQAVYMPVTEVFSGSAGQDARRWIGRFDREFARNLGATLADWLDLFNCALEGEAADWADSDYQVSGLLSVD